MSRPEQRVVNATIKVLDNAGIFHFNLSAGNGVTGLPDRLAFPPGAVLPLEFKKPKGGRLSGRQKYVHERFAAAGWPVLIVTDAQQVRDALAAGQSPTHPEGGAR